VVVAMEDKAAIIRDSRAEETLAIVLGNHCEWFNTKLLVADLPLVLNHEI